MISEGPSNRVEILCPEPSQSAPFDPQSQTVKIYDLLSISGVLFFIFRHSENMRDTAQLIRIGLNERERERESNLGYIVKVPISSELPQ